MRVHHLKCGAMQPYGGALFDGQTRGLGPAELCCHCLLLEIGSRLVLVDTGTVSADPEAAAYNHSPFFRVVDRIRLDPAEAAANQLAATGHAPADVTDIVMTHLDFDHAAGLVDFPAARIHLSATEAAAARHPSGPINRARYQPAQFGKSEPNWRTYARFNQDWFGLPMAELEDLPELSLIALPGHTPGHCGVAVQEDGGWLLHAGDAIFNGRELDPVHPHTPSGARAYQWLMQTSQVRRRRSLKQLRRLKRDHAGEISIICTHDPSMIKSHSGASSGFTRAEVKRAPPEARL